MEVRLLLRGTVCLTLMSVSSIAMAGGWHNSITRKLGIWYSDGYHAQEGCPTEKVGGWKRHGHAAYADGHEYAGREEHASPFADQHRAYSRPLRGGPAYGVPFEDEAFGAELQPGEPTPARPRAPVMPKAPNDPNVPMRQGHSEARLPSSMFPLAPLR